MEDGPSTPPTPDLGPRPLQVVVIDPETKRFTLNEEALSSILLNPICANRPVVVVSVAGPFRLGKSFLLNFFLRYMNESTEEEDADADWIRKSEELSGFKWRHGSSRETTGIWIWSQPFLRRLPGSGKTVAVLLVDTQGTFDNKTTMKENATIFALNALISSFQVYNISKLLGEDKLQHMHLFTKFGQFVHEQDTDAADTRKPFQTLQFLVRDWANKKEFAYGAKGGDQYLESVLSSETGDANEELRSVREQIRSCFESLHCYLMPHPGMEVAEEEDFRGDVDAIRDLFVEQLQDFVPRVLSRSSLVVKKVSGEEVTCAGLHAYIKEYVKVFSAGDLPEVQTVFEATATVNHINVKNKALNAYQEHMRTACGPGRPFMEQADLDQVHVAALEKADKLFRDTKKLSSPALEKKFQGQLHEEVEKLYEEYCESNRSKHLLAGLRTPITIGGLAFLCNILSTILGLIGLSSLAYLFSNITWLAIIVVGIWAYCSWTGSYSDVSAEIDNAAKLIFEFVQEHVVAYALGPTAAQAVTKKKK